MVCLPVMEPDKSLLNVADILAFADTVDLSLVSELIDRQIDYNSGELTLRLADGTERRYWFKEVEPLF